MILLIYYILFQVVKIVKSLVVHSSQLALNHFGSESSYQCSYHEKLDYAISKKLLVVIIIVIIFSEELQLQNNCHLAINHIRRVIYDDVGLKIINKKLY